jgi:membrane associated rhomboid family serine protease
LFDTYIGVERERAIMIGAALAPLTLIIIIFTTFASIQGFRQPDIVEKFLFSTEAISRRKQYYRMVTSALVHGDWGHLLFNMFSLYSFGGFMEKGLKFGMLPLAIIYVSSIVGGNLLTLYAHRNREYRALGASGGVCGVIFACIFLFPGTGISFFLIPVSIPASVYAIIFIGVSFWGIRSQRGLIGHDAHLGGAIIGLLMTTVLFPSIVVQSPILYLVVIGVSIALFVYFYKYPPLPRKSKSDLFSRRYWRGEPVDDPPKRQSKRRQREEVREEHDEQTMNRLLDKISISGMESLTEFERKQLEHISRRMRGRKH